MPQHTIQRIETNEVSDSMYIHLSTKPIAFSVELSPDVILDIDADNNVVGIDFQHVTAVMKERAFIQGSRGQSGRQSPSAPVRLQLLSV